MIDYLDFRKELTDLINSKSMENGSDTQDFILANYLTACLVAFDQAVNERDRLAPNLIGNNPQLSEKDKVDEKQ